MSLSKRLDQVDNSLVREIAIAAISDIHDGKATEKVSR